MATKDDTTTETEDDIDVVEVDAASGDEAKVAAEAAAADPPAKDDDKTDDDDEHQEDARLAERDEEDSDGTPAERKKRLNQRQRAKIARDRTESELRDLRAQVAELTRGQQEIRTTNLSVSETMVTSRLEEVRRDIATAESILADAVKNSDGDAYATALRLRDEAKTQEADLVVAQRGFTEAKKQPATNTEVARLSQQWKSANAAWYGVDAAATNLTNTIDAGLTAEGYDPASRDYWSELTRRVTARLARSDDTQQETRRETTDNKRKGPAIGDRGGGANGDGSGKRVVHLSKDRVDAIKAAGAWDDPKERAALIREYEKYDREQSANR